MNTKNIIILSYIAATLLMAGCSYDETDDDVLVSRRMASDYGQQDKNKDFTIWKFIHEQSMIYYLWHENVPDYGIQYSLYDTPQEFFESFRHADDRFSAVLDDYTETEGSFNNEFTTDGLNYQLYLDDSGQDNVIAIVEYVYDNSPAQEAGMKRGDVIHKVNGEQLTIDNYNKLLSRSTTKYTYSKIKKTIINGREEYSYGDDLQESPEITKRHMDIDPVLFKTVFNRNEKKIGYLLYDSFTKKTQTVIDAIEYFKAQNIDELILDLRLNGGGHLSTLETIASMLVPDGHVGDVFIKESFNPILDQQYKETLGSDYNVTKFIKTDTKLNLDRLFVITSRHTASASEELISGLMPYMPVTIIGEQTYGKFTSNYLINDTIDIGHDPDGIPYDEWAVYLCVASCTNANGEMNFKKGFVPDFPIGDVYQHAPYNEEDPMLAKALELCAGGSLAKSLTIYPSPLKGYIAPYGKPIDKFGMVSKNKIQTKFCN